MVICYFGHWPPWINCYLESCRYNPSIDFLIFTDCGQLGSPCENVSIIDSTLEQFNARASAKLDLPIKVEAPYKLIDFKPAYGVIFDDFLENYDFWGVADIDLVYGNIRDFLTEQLLAEHDVISARREYLAGHLTLYRNRPEINRLYETGADHPRVFLESELFSFGECSRMWRHLHNGGSIFEKEVFLDKNSLKKEKPRVESMTHIVKRLDKENYLRAHFRTMIKDRPELRGQDWELSWQQGHLSDVTTGEQFLYFHMIGLKDRSDFKMPRWEVVPEQFFITRKGFSLTRRSDKNVVFRWLDKISALKARFRADDLPY